MATQVLEVRGVNSFYKEGHSIMKSRVERRQILHDISFRLDTGEILGLVGESGCGKSTLAKSILGINKDYEGKITHYSQNPQMVFQDPFSSLNPAKSIGWIMGEPLRIQKKLRDSEIKKEVITMLTKVGLSEDYYDRRPWELSGGQRQRVSIGTALITHPQLVILDEPVSALDVTIQAQILKLLVDLKKEFDLSYLFISHDLNVVYQLCDWVLVMKEGTIVEQNTVDKLFSNPQHEYTKQLLEVAD